MSMSMSAFSPRHVLKEKLSAIAELNYNQCTNLHMDDIRIGVGMDYQCVAGGSDGYQHLRIGYSGYPNVSRDSGGYHQESSGSGSYRHENSGTCGYRQDSIYAGGYYNDNMYSGGYRHDTSGYGGYHHVNGGAGDYPYVGIGSGLGNSFSGYDVGATDDVDACSLDDLYALIDSGMAIFGELNDISKIDPASYQQLIDDTLTDSGDIADVLTVMSSTSTVG